MWWFVALQSTEVWALYIFTNCVRLCLSAGVTGTCSHIPSGTYLWNINYSVPFCSLSGQARNNCGTNPEQAFPLLEDLMYPLSHQTQARRNHNLDILWRLILALLWMCSIPGEVSMLFWYCIQGKDYCFSVNCGWTFTRGNFQFETGLLLSTMDWIQRDLRCSRVERGVAGVWERKGSIWWKLK